MSISKEQVEASIELHRECDAIREEIVKNNDKRNKVTGHEKRKFTKKIKELGARYDKIMITLQNAPALPIDPAEALKQLQDKFSDLGYEVFDAQRDEVIQEVSRGRYSLAYILTWDLGELIISEYLALNFKNWFNIKQRENESEFDMVVRAIEWLSRIYESMEIEVASFAFSSSSNPSRNLINRFKAEAGYRFTRSPRNIEDIVLGLKSYAVLNGLECSL